MLELVAALRAALRVLEHRSHAAAVLAGQAGVGAETVLDLLEAAGRGLHGLLVAAQVAGHVLGLDPQGPQALGQRVELGVDARGRVERRLGRGQHGRRAGVAAGRLGAGQRRHAQGLEVAQALSLGHQRALVLLGGLELLDLAQLVGEQVELALARARALAKLLQPARRLAGRGVGGRTGGASLRLLGAGEGVERVELGGGQRELAVLVLAVEGQQPLRSCT